MNILLVEDDSDKLRQVAGVIAGCDPLAEVDSAQNVAQAKRMLVSKQYDLLVLDVCLPASAAVLASEAGGVELLRLIAKGTTLQKPKHIVGLTAFSDVRTRVENSFTNELWSVIEFDRSSEAWSNRLKDKIAYIQAASESVVLGEYGCEVAVITALRTPELDAVLKWLPWNWKRLPRVNDATDYHEGSFLQGATSKKVIAAACTKMGMPSATALSMKIIHEFRPKYLAMVGVAAGVRGTCALGDVIAADPCWDWGNGKFSTRKGVDVFEAAPEQIPLDAFTKARLKSISDDPLPLERIRADWIASPMPGPLRLHIGPMASGAAVLADGKTSSSIRTQHRKLLGIDMEAYAIFSATTECSLPRPIPVVLKSVSDFADAGKRNSHQPYAAYTSASVLRMLFESTP